MHKLFEYIRINDSFPKLDWITKEEFIKFCYGVYKMATILNKAISFNDFYNTELFLLQNNPTIFKFYNFKKYGK